MVTACVEQLPELSKYAYIEQISTSCISHYAYYIEAENKDCIIIDPLRDITPYLELIKKRGSNLMYILESHFHADFVSGHLELSRKT